MQTTIDKLPDNFEELKAIIHGKDEHITILEEQIRVLKKAIFGRKSEKRPAEEPGAAEQLNMFNEAEVLVEEQAQKELVIPEHTRQKPKRKPLPQDLPRVEVVHDIDEQEKLCQCGSEMSRIGEEVCEKLDIIPAKIRVIRHIRPKYACKNCEGVESDGPTVKISPPPPQIVPKGMATPGLIAHIAISKYADALPLYRQEKIFSRYGIELTRATMAGWLVKSTECCNPIMELLHKELHSGPLVNVDETPLQVLNEPGRANTTKSYMWVFRGGPPAKPVILYHYSSSRSGEVAREVLAGYRGYCQTDGFSGYDAFETAIPGIVLVGCFAHVRRNFVKIIDARGKAAKNKPGSAEVALDYIGRLYKIEKAVRQRELLPDEIVSFRREHALPVLEEFKAWMDKRIDQTPPKGLLGKALNYALNQWPRLIRYIENGHITPDNNPAENAIRPFVVGRKNFLFAGHPNGAHAGATLYSLIETAKACGLDPYRYLRLLFEKIPYARTEEDYRALLPQNFTPERLAQFIAAAL
ncbi:MAG: transposase [Thermodesulfobacteriota bacterium]|nr:transposase [Thermodesulfobacteriota bacterium]